MQPAYKELCIESGALPISEKIHREVLSLPIGPTMSQDEARTVITAIRQAVAELQ